MAEYIKRTDVMKICEGYSKHCFSSNDAKGQDIADRILDDVVEIPTADVEEVKQGQFVRNERNIPKMKEFHKKGFALSTNEKSIFYTCSECGEWISLSQKYCSECGAKMDGGKEE